MAPWLDRSGRFSPFKTAVFVALFLPGAWIAFAYVTGRLEPLPFTQAIHHAGLWAIRLLIVTLAVTPFRRLFHWPELIQIRRMIGVGAFAYAIAHLSLYVIDQSFDLGKVASEIALRFYLTIGFVALVGLSALAATSTDGMLRRLGGRRWRRLHKLVYPIALLGVVHYFLQSKANVSEPTVVAGIFLWLMGYRALHAMLGEERRMPVAAVFALAVAAGLVTALGEAVYFWARMGADPLRVLAADLVFRFGPRPAWFVLAITLAVAAIALVRKSAGTRQRERRAERRRALAAEAR
jgi:sulfoxide reductase heme-binding subunit YedZ